MINLTPTTHRADQCAAFRRSRERHGDLSNMTFGFPLVAAGLRLQGPEGLYQALKFPHDEQAQRHIATQRSGMDAKKAAYTHRNVRPDWETVKTTAMAFTLATKLRQHPDRFGNALLGTGELPIVEHSMRDPFWGAQPGPDATLTGTNALGQLLTQLRDQLMANNGDARAAVAAFLKGTDTSSLRVLGKAPRQPDPHADILNHPTLPLTVHPVQDGVHDVRWNDEKAGRLDRQPKKPRLL